MGTKYRAAPSVTLPGTQRTHRDHNLGFGDIVDNAAANSTFRTSCVRTSRAPHFCCRDIKDPEKACLKRAQ